VLLLHAVFQLRWWQSCWLWSCQQVAATNTTCQPSLRSQLLLTRPALSGPGAASWPAPRLAARTAGLVLLLGSGMNDPTPVPLQVRDIWLEEDVGLFTARFTAAKVEPHEARFVTLKWVLRCVRACSRCLNRLARAMSVGCRHLTHAARPRAKHATPVRLHPQPLQAQLPARSSTPHSPTSPASVHHGQVAGARRG
jgi:hypothetical protein